MVVNYKELPGMVLVLRTINNPDAHREAGFTDMREQLALFDVTRTSNNTQQFEIIKNPSEYLMGGVLKYEEGSHTFPVVNVDKKIWKSDGSTERRLIKDVMFASTGEQYNLLDGEKLHVLRSMNACVALGSRFTDLPADVQDKYRIPQRFNIRMDTPRHFRSSVTDSELMAPPQQQMPHAATPVASPAAITSAADFLNFDDVTIPPTPPATEAADPFEGVGPHAPTRGGRGGRAVERMRGGGGTHGVRPATAPATPKMAKLPQHVVNVLAKAMVDGHATCPVTLEDLTMADIRITPCGHAVSEAAAGSCFATKKECPVCRAKCSVGDLAKAS